MSQITDIVTALVSDVTTALSVPSSYKSVDAVYTEMTQLREGDLPKAMVFNPSYEAERLDTFKQTRETITLGVVLVRKAAQVLQMRTDLEAVIAQMEADSTLGGIVDDVLVDAGEIDETQSTIVFTILTVQTQKVT